MYYTKDVIKSEKLVDVKELILDTQSDDRGEIWPVYSSNNDFLPSFVDDKITISHKKVLRGLHGDSETGKLITCLAGEFQLVAVDLRKNSTTYGQKQSWTLTEAKPISIYVPPGFVNGHLCLSTKCIFHYKWTKAYKGFKNQITIRWDDPKLNIKWLEKKPILSERDLNGTSSEGVFL